MDNNSFSSFSLATLSLDEVSSIVASFTFKLSVDSNSLAAKSVSVVFCEDTSSALTTLRDNSARIRIDKITILLFLKIIVSPHLIK